MGLQLAKTENYSKICIEGDAKFCIDALNGSMTNVWWKIDTFCKDSKTLNLDFDVCSFCWVYRETNSVAYALAKLLLIIPFSSVVILILSHPLFQRCG